MRALLTTVTITVSLFGLTPPTSAFCGFYVARADSELFNQASHVVMVRDGDRTVLTMANDYQGEPSEFALVVPVPTFIEREQIHVANPALIDHLDAYTAPRLVEYFDEDPCAVRRMEKFAMADAAAPEAEESRSRAGALGVVVEARYTVGEYEIVILSAEQSAGLTTWLRQEGYRLPEGAEPVLASYLRQDVRFFVARVDLGEHRRLGYSQLRPLQVAYESPRFGLPIRLGTANARGPQELIIHTLTRRGRVETTNYRTVRIPTDVEIPERVEGDFGGFYRALFDEQVERERMRAVFLEHAWDMSWCDPCAADPLSHDELRELGVFWLDPTAQRRGPAADVFVTRLHVRYDGETFPDDLRFHETGDRSSFQGRYVIRHPWRGSSSCPAAEAYRSELRERQARAERTLASLTGGALGDPDATTSGTDSWWRRLWDR